MPCGSSKPEPPLDFARFDAHYTYGAIAQLGNEQPMTIEVDRQVIDASIDVAERDLRFEAQREALLSASRHWPQRGN